VRPFPAVSTGHWQVSTGGGTRPLWTPGRPELVYVAPTGALMRVALEPSASWAATTPTTLVKEGYFTNPGDVLSGRTLDISPDGERFLMVKSSGGTDQTALQPRIVVVQRFDEELKRLVPAK
jgi:eukaryotic-like serine/threonine-protein kinase